MEFQPKHEKLLEDIHGYIVGTELHPNGLDQRLRKTEKKTDKHELYFRVIFGICTVSVFIVGFWNKIVLMVKMPLNLKKSYIYKFILYM